MKQDYRARLKVAEGAILCLNPDEALDLWMKEHYTCSWPPYLDVASQVPSGLRKLCFQRGFAELERVYREKHDRTSD